MRGHRAGRNRDSGFRPDCQIAGPRSIWCRCDGERGSQPPRDGVSPEGLSDSHPLFGEFRSGTISDLWLASSVLYGERADAEGPNCPRPGAPAHGQGMILVAVVIGSLLRAPLCHGGEEDCYAQHLWSSVSKLLLGGGVKMSKAGGAGGRPRAFPISVILLT